MVAISASKHQLCLQIVRSVAIPSIIRSPDRANKLWTRTCPRRGRFGGTVGSIPPRIWPFWGTFGMQVLRFEWPILGDSGPKLGPPGGPFWGMGGSGPCGRFRGSYRYRMAGTAHLRDNGRISLSILWLPFQCGDGVAANVGIRVLLLTHGWSRTPPSR